MKTEEELKKEIKEKLDAMEFYIWDGKISQREALVETFYFGQDKGTLVEQERSKKLCDKCKPYQEGIIKGTLAERNRILEIVNTLDEIRNKDNSLSLITIGNNFTTNSVKYLKKELKQKIGDGK